MNKQQDFTPWCPRTVLLHYREYAPDSNGTIHARDEITSGEHKTYFPKKTALVAQKVVRAAIEKAMRGE